MKKLFCILLCASMVLLWGCTPGDSDTLSGSLRAEIEAYYGGAGDYDDADTVAGKQYYGTYNGYVILMDAGMLAAISQVDIGGRVFRWGSMALTLTAYKDGQTQSLEELYESGGITEADLDRILEKHKAHFATQHNWDHDSL